MTATMVTTMIRLMVPLLLMLMTKMNYFLVLQQQSSAHQGAAVVEELRHFAYFVTVYGAGRSRQLAR
jgi:hypothetical protein